MKHKFQLLGYGSEIMKVGIYQQRFRDYSKVIFVCECGKQKEVKLK